MSMSPTTRDDARNSRRSWRPRGAEVEGPDAALTIVDGLDLGSYHLFHAIRADMLRLLGCNAETTLAYEAAIAGTANTAERDFLRRKRRDLR